MASSSEDAVREEKVAAMGEELGDLHFLLWRDVTWLHLEWRQYRELFGTHQTRIDLMNNTAPRFFWSLERVLWQDILLTLSRFLDPPGTGGQQNLTFLRFPALIKDSGLREQVVAGLDNYEQRAGFARHWRHRRYAHRELTHATDSVANPLATASRGNVEQALSAARDLMNLVEGHYQDSTTAYEHSGDGGGGAQALLWYLDAGLEAAEERERNNVWQRPRFT